MNMPRTYPEGVTCWVDIEEADVEEAARFYGVLFGWTFLESEPKLRYLIARLDGQDAAGIGRLNSPDVTAARSPAWTTYISVRDIEQVAARLVAAGGRITEPPSTLDEAALTASCVDREGIPFRLWQATRRPGAQAANSPGAWNFSDLHTADPDASIAFYTQVFGWKFDDIGFRDHDSSTGIRRSPRGDVRPGNPRASIRGPGAAWFRRCLRLARYDTGGATTPLARDIHRRGPRRLCRSRRAARCDCVVHH
jgi:uncharacterized protein